MVIVAKKMYTYKRFFILRFYMKKLLLSTFVIGLFIVNGLLRQELANSTPLTIPPPQNANNQVTGSTQNSLGNPSSQSTPTTTQASGSTTPPTSQGQYKDGTYTGSVADAFYGNVQIQVVIGGGRITDVVFLQYPNDRSTSIAINTQAMPYLKQEAIQAQSAQVDIVSGASDTSQAFQASLASALAQAH